MHADHVAGPLGVGGDLVDVEAGGVGGQDGARLGDLVELLEDGLLDFHRLEHRLDDDVGVLEGVVVERRRDQRHALLDVLGLHAAALGGVLVVGADGLEAAIQRFLAGLEHRHGDACVGEVHGDATAHRAGADDAAGLDLALRRVGRHVLDLGGFALGEEVIALGGRFLRGQQLAEQFALALHALVERQFDGGLDALDDVPRRLEAARLAGDRLLGLGEQLRRLERHGEVADAAQRRLLRQQHLGVGDRALQQVAFDDGIDDALALGLGGRDVTARQDGVERVLGAGEARQALGATGARQQAEMHFRQAHARGRQGDAIVRAQRRLEAAAQRRAVQRGHDQLGRVLHGCDDVVQVRARRRLAELADVGAGDEGAAAADQHDGIDVRIPAERLDAVLDAGAHRRGQCIHWRIVDGEDSDAPLCGAYDSVGHGRSSLSETRNGRVVLASSGCPAQRPCVSPCGDRCSYTA